MYESKLKFYPCSNIYDHRVMLYLDLPETRDDGSAFECSDENDLSVPDAALGVRGQSKAGGTLSYDLFAAKPLHKPDRFQTTKTTFGFNLNYSF